MFEALHPLRDGFERSLPTLRKPFAGLLGRLLLLSLAAVATLQAAPAAACDVCAIYTAAELGPSRLGPRIGVAEQYSFFGTLKTGTDTVPNPGERMNSSITQVFFGYEFTPRIGLQLNLPIINRTFRRLEEGVLRNGSVTGVGDLALSGRYVALDTATEHIVARISLMGGLKFPTGDPDRLQEELAEDHVDEGGEHEEELFTRASLGAPRFGKVAHGGVSHDEPSSGIHGHDLALGTGSVDGFIGTEMYASYDRAFFVAGVQYIMRTKGAFDYQYANDLTWNGGPGYYVFLQHDLTLALQAVISGETKGQDTFAGERLDDTSITALYVGPGLRFTWGTSLAAEVTGDLPVYQNVTSLQIVPDYRIRAGLVWRF